jgi:prepilin-type N-terminal cleavage/methylation domain-containing protein
MRSNRGITLIELLAALVISALVVALASRIYLNGHREFLARVFESDRLTTLVRAKGTLHEVLRGEVAHCRNEQLILVGGSLDSSQDVAVGLKARFPGVDSITFRCFEVDEVRGELVEWRERFQPQLIEYRMVLNTRGRRDKLEGSVLK